MDLTEPTQKIARPAIGTLLVFDVLAIAVLVVAVAVVDPALMVSVLVGSLVFFIPNASFTWLSFRVMGARQIRQVAHRFYQAEMIKFILTSGLFIYALTLLPSLDVLTLFAAYIAILLVHQLAAFRLIDRGHTG